MGRYTFYQYFLDQWARLPIPKAVDDVRSKTFMVIGSNVGLGFEASVHLASMQPKSLIATCRNQVKCEETRKSIIKRAVARGLPDTQVQALPLELGSFQDVRSFVDRFAANGDGRLDALVANAGLLPNGYTLTQDGWETVLQVNYISTALLSILLLPHLVKSPSPDSPSRLVIVSSFIHHQASSKKLEGADNILATINKREYPEGDRYPISKLLEVIFVRELASRLPEPTPVIACTVNPGFSQSSIFRAPTLRLLSLLFSKIFLVRTTEEGSKTLVHAAVASDRSMHGRYLSSCRVAEENDFLFTPQGKTFSARIWDETIAVLSDIDGRVPEIVEQYLQVDPS